MSAKRKHRSANEYLKYLKGELTPEERHSFERGLEADPFEMEAMEGMENISNNELEEDLLSLHANLQKRLSKKRRRNWYYVAATVASLLIVGTVFLNIYEIDPKTSSESIPADESLFYEDAGIQSEEKSEALVSEEAAPESDVPEGEIRERDIDAVEEDVVETDRVEFAEAEAEPMKAEAAQIREAEDNVQEDKALDLEVEAPAPVAEEVVAVEAQPKRSQKKGRAAEAPASYAGRVSGIVLSAEDMEPLPGASIVVKDSDSGMVADMEGRFAFVTDKQDPATVIASYVGMETEEHQLAGGVENRVVMQPDLTTLNEVVVIGYEEGVMANPTGAVQNVKLEPEKDIYSGAEPEGGLNAFKMYIEEQIRFPAGDTLSKREVVILKFNVDQDGSISNIQTLRSPGILFSEEAIRLLQEGPVWNPAQNESGATEDVVRMRIVFKQ